jgi:hypothetical protein
MKSIQDKKVLLFAPCFFDYEIEIVEEFRRRGAEIDFLPDRPFQSSFMKGLIRVRRELVLWYADRFFLNAIEKFGRNDYDLILVIQGEGVSPRLLSSLRSIFPNAVFILYMWDSFKNKKSLVPNIVYFDKCFSFDPEDAKNYGMKFRPLFYSGVFSRDFDASYEFDVSFIGTMHSDRYSIISKMVSYLPISATVYMHFYMQAPWMFWMHKISNRSFKAARIKEFQFSSLLKTEVQRVFSSSRAILDIQHPDQIGLTMRSLEALGNRKKLITTNKSIVDYDFFNPNNIFVLDRDAISAVPKSFLTEPYEEISEDLYLKYSLAGWVDALLD